MEKNDELIVKLKNVKKESKYIDFKERINLQENRDWCEIIKDVVAMANSGGGSILFGMMNNGKPSVFDASAIIQIDPAKITDKINAYTGIQFCNFEITSIERDGIKIGVWTIKESENLIIFIRPGTYNDENGKQKTVFSKGTIYFRHGAKSEPGNSEDLMQFVEKKVEKIRKSWLGDIRKVIQAPIGYKISILPPNIIETRDQKAMAIRIVDDPDAPGYQKIDSDITHPYRQKELLECFNSKMKDMKSITSFDIHCIRKVHKIDELSPQYFYKPKFGSPQYSDQFVDWLIEHYKEDNEFFEKTRLAYKGLI